MTTIRVDNDHIRIDKLEEADEVREANSEKLI
jgi:hypothetical protein